VSAVSTAVTIRSLDLISVLTLFFWVLSPIGGQSSLRLLQETTNTTYTTGTAYYADPNPNLLRFETQDMLTASLMAPQRTKVSPLDLWNRPKIPRITDLERKRDLVDHTKSEWSSTVANQSYTSLTGINVQGLVSRSNSSFNAVHQYISLDCKLRFNETLNDIVEQLDLYFPNLYPSINHTFRDPFDDLFPFPESSYVPLEEWTAKTAMFFRFGGENDTRSNFSASEADGRSIQFMFGLYELPPAYSTSRDGMVVVYQCAPNLIMVDARISCQDNICEVEKIRRSQTPLPEARNCEGYFDRRLKCLIKDTKSLRNLITSGGKATWWFFSQLQNEMRDTNGFGNDLVSERLSLWFNTWWQAGAFSSSATVRNPYDIPPQKIVDDTATAGGFWMIPANATFSTKIPVYQRNTAWILTQLFASTVLLLMGILNIAIYLTTLAPDYFTYISAFTRDNPYVRVPEGGSGLDGSERSRLLRKMKVQIADAKPESDVGYVVLKSVEDEAEFASGQLRKGRLYE